MVGRIIHMRWLTLFSVGFLLLLFQPALGSTNQVDPNSVWRGLDGEGMPRDATSIGTGRDGRAIYICRAQYKGGWQLGRILHQRCLHRGDKRDVVHSESQVLSLPPSSRWISVAGKYRGADAVDLELGGKFTTLCRVRRAGRTFVGVVRAKGCQTFTSTRSSSNLFKAYELLIDPGARESRRYRQAVLELRKVIHDLSNLLSEVNAALQRELQAKQLELLARRVAPALKSARGTYERLESGIMPSKLPSLRALYASELEPLLGQLGRAQDRLATAGRLAVAQQRCIELERDIRKTVDVLTADTMLAGKISARQRIAALSGLQERLNQERTAVRKTGSRALNTRIEKLFAPLPALLSDAIYNLQPWLPIKDRQSLFGAYVAGLSPKTPGSILVALRLLLELFRPTDPSLEVAQVVDLWLALTDEVASSLEQRERLELPDFNAVAERPETHSELRAFVANLRRNGLRWLETQPDPDELGRGQASRFLLFTDHEWIAKRLRQKVPPDVRERVACLRWPIWETGSLAAQLNRCSQFWEKFPKSTLARKLKDELEALVGAYGRTLNRRRCSKEVKATKSPVFAALLRDTCGLKTSQMKVSEGLNAQFQVVRSLIARGKLKAARRALGAMGKRYPHNSALFQLRYEMRRAERQRDEERMSAGQYAQRLRGIESRLSGLEQICVKSAREYRRARKRMRAALRRGMEGRAAHFRRSHDRSFYQACGARDQVLELLAAQRTMAQPQAARVTRETAPSCLSRWRVCDRNP